MRFKAVLKTDSVDAKSVASALDVDNIDMENLKLSTDAEGGWILTQIESNNIRAMVNTVDDIISSQMVAERVIN